MKAGPIAWFAQNAIAANLLLIVIVVAGLIRMAEQSVTHVVACSSGNCR